MKSYSTWANWLVLLVFACHVMHNRCMCHRCLFNAHVHTFFASYRRRHSKTQCQHPILHLHLPRSTQIFYNQEKRAVIYPSTMMVLVRQMSSHPILFNDLRTYGKTEWKRRVVNRWKFEFLLSVSLLSNFFFCCSLS